MLTRCPACQTTFRVTPEQLRAHSGRVRCGQCQHAFNAIDTLLEAPVVSRPFEPAPRDPSVSIPEPSGSAFDSPPVTSSELMAADTPAADEIAVLPEPTFKSESESGPQFETAEAPSPTALVPAESAAPIDAKESATEPEPEPLFILPPPTPRRWPWVIGSLITLLVLVIQMTIAFRIGLAVRMPEARPALAALCDLAGCEVGLPAEADLIGIEASDLHSDPQHPEQLEVSATLKNRAPFAQAWPYLELTLTDTADKAVVRKALAPADYLPARTTVATGMPAHGDAAVSFVVAADGLAVSGYRLYLFYP